MRMLVSVLALLVAGMLAGCASSRATDVEPAPVAADDDRYEIQESIRPWIGVVPVAESSRTLKADLWSLARRSMLVDVRVAFLDGRGAVVDYSEWYTIALEPEAPTRVDVQTGNRRARQGRLAVRPAR